MSAAGIEWAAAHSWERSANELRVVLVGAIEAARRGETFEVSPEAIAGIEPAEDGQISDAG
jgi:hypothetical protein